MTSPSLTIKCDFISAGLALIQSNVWPAFCAETTFFPKRSELDFVYCAPMLGGKTSSSSFCSTRAYSSYFISENLIWRRNFFHRKSNWLGHCLLGLLPFGINFAIFCLACRRFRTPPSSWGFNLALLINFGVLFSSKKCIISIHLTATVSVWIVPFSFNSNLTFTTERHLISLSRGWRSHMIFQL